MERVWGLCGELLEAVVGLGLRVRAVWGRVRRRYAGEGDRPVCLYGGGEGVEKTVGMEMGLRYWIDFGGYSCGFFLDQRGNREYLGQMRLRRVLNTFSYTGSFSLVAAKGGAETWSVDISGRAMDWARENFRLNGVDVVGHHFYVDDVLEVLPRLRRRGLVFDAIILDPPTFSRCGRGRFWDVKGMYVDLIGMAAPLLREGGRMLFSVNTQGVDVRVLKSWARGVLGGGFVFEEAPVPEDVWGSPHAVGVWCRRMRMV
jgi:23S rRNA (cytosine1962-C5)-methyltransferase